MYKLLPKSKYPTEMLYFQTEHTLIIYVQFILGPKRKTSSLSGVSDSIFQTLKIWLLIFRDCFNSDNRLRAIFLVTAYFWRSE